VTADSAGSATPSTTLPGSTATAGSTPAALHARVVLDRFRLRLHAARLQLSWRASAGVAPGRYLVVWSARRTPHGRLVAHRSWTTAPALRLPRATPHTIRVTVTAYGADGTLLRRATHTVRLTR
jgi:hypothetical protein